MTILERKSEDNNEGYTCPICEQDLVDITTMQERANHIRTYICKECLLRMTVNLKYESEE